MSFAAEHSTVTGLAIAFGEVAVGLGTLLGLFTRIAALGGFLLALSFFLTVSWTTRPYYFGADIVFVAAWTTLLIAHIRRWCPGRGPSDRSIHWLPDALKRFWSTRERGPASSRRGLVGGGATAVRRRG